MNTQNKTAGKTAKYQFALDTTYNGYWDTIEEAVQEAKKQISKSSPGTYDSVGIYTDEAHGSELITEEVAEVYGLSEFLEEHNAGETAPVELYNTDPKLWENDFTKVSNLFAKEFIKFLDKNTNSMAIDCEAYFNELDTRVSEVDGTYEGKHSYEMSPSETISGKPELFTFDIVELEAPDNDDELPVIRYDVAR